MPPVPEANSYLPKDHLMLRAFDVVALKHALLIGVVHTSAEIRAIPFENLQGAASDFFTAGVAFLANRGHDAYLQEVGTVAWWAVNQHRAITVMTNNMVGAAIAFGVPAEIAFNSFHTNDEPQLIMFGHASGKVILESAYVLIPPEFIIRAKDCPIDGLATMAYICSQLRDLMNGRLAIDKDMMNPRAWATEAHFLLEAMEKHPGVELREVFHEVIRRYPDGFNDLPATAKYKGITGTEFMNANSN